MALSSVALEELSKLVCSVPTGTSRLHKPNWPEIDQTLNPSEYRLERTIRHFVSIGVDEMQCRRLVRVHKINCFQLGKAVEDRKYFLRILYAEFPVYIPPNRTRSEEVQLNPL